MRITSEAMKSSGWGSWVERQTETTAQECATGKTGPRHGSMRDVRVWAQSRDLPEKHPSLPGAKRKVARARNVNGSEIPLLMAPFLRTRLGKQPKHMDPNEPIL